MLYFRPLTGADPDLQIRGVGGGAGHPDPEMGGGGGSPKKYFQPFGPQFGLKIREVPRPHAPPLDQQLLKSFFHYK